MHYFSQESAVNFTDLLQDVDKQMTVGVVSRLQWRFSRPVPRFGGK